MSIDTRNLKRCHCGRLFEVFSHAVGDQTQCGACQDKLRREFEEQQNRDDAMKHHPAFKRRN